MQKLNYFGKPTKTNSMHFDQLLLHGGSEIKTIQKGRSQEPKHRINKPSVPYQPQQDFGDVIVWMATASFTGAKEPRRSVTPA